MSDPLASIVVTPRERFSAALRSLDSLLDHTTGPHQLIYVDAGSPPWIRRRIADRARTHGFEHLRIRRAPFPNRCRNVGLQRARGRYVVFVENDLLFAPGWLEALVRCAEETGAAIVGPLVLEGEFERAFVHQAGGEAHFVEGPAGREFVGSRRFHGDDPQRIRHLLKRAETEQIEFHCLLARCSLFEQVGMLDETYSTVLEYTDLCLKARAHGLSVFFEPTSLVSYLNPYLNPKRLGFSDLPYYWKRWGHDATRQSFEHFRREWGMGASETGLESVLGFVEFQRRLPRRRLGAALRRLAGRGALAVVPNASDLPASGASRPPEPRE